MVKIAYEPFMKHHSTSHWCFFSFAALYDAAGQRVSWVAAAAHCFIAVVATLPSLLSKRLFVVQSAKIFQGTILDDNCALGANAVVSTLEAPSGAVIVGIPGRVKRVIEE